MVLPLRKIVPMGEPDEGAFMAGADRLQRPSHVSAPLARAKRERLVVVELFSRPLDRRMEHHLAQHAGNKLRHVVRLPVLAHDDPLEIL